MSFWDEWQKNVGRKPRVLFLIDIPDWAYDINAHGVKSVLSGEFDIDFAYLHHGQYPDLHPDYYDIYHVCCWIDLVSTSGIAPERFVKEVSSHRWEEDRFGSLTPRQFCQKYLSDSGTITATSRRLQKLIGNIRPCLLVPNGVADFFKPGEPRAGNLVFGWAGNANDPCKGLKDILLPAAYRLTDLQIAPGNLSHREMALFYQKLDVICVASDREGEPLPLLEGMACGCFPVSADVGIAPELIRNGENGLIVERTPEAFRKAFRWCLENAAFVREAGKKNSAMIRRSRSWPAVSGAWRRAWTAALSLCGVDEAANRLAVKRNVGSMSENCPELKDSLIHADCGNLSASGWHDAIVSGKKIETLAKRIINGESPPWLEEIMRATEPGQKCLELGSATGELSACLSLAGREVTLLDFSQESLDFSEKLFRELELGARFVNANILENLPFPANAFDCVWSGGVLEHFDQKELAHIMSESARVSRGKVISLVPNAASLPYHFGKWTQEKLGIWKYGFEDPKFSLKKEFLGAGLKDIIEYSIEPFHALKFMECLPGFAGMTKAIGNFYRTLQADELAKMNQGYLLVTIGVKHY